MCLDPVTMTAALGSMMGTTASTAASAIGLAGTGLSVAGTIMQGRAQNKAYQRQADIAEQQAAQAQERGKVEQMQHAMRANAEKGQQVSALSGSGVSMGSGSALQILEDTAQAASFDSQMIRYNSDLESWGHRGQAALDRAAGKNAQRASYFNAAGSALTGLSKFGKDSLKTAATNGSTVAPVYR